MERALAAGFEADLDRLAAALAPDRLDLAREIAAAPQEIRGFGPVKEAAVEAWRQVNESLWARWEGEPEPPKQRLQISRKAPTEAA